jgi:hypothetical protein
VAGALGRIDLERLDGELGTTPSSHACSVALGAARNGKGRRREGKGDEGADEHDPNGAGRSWTSGRMCAWCSSFWPFDPHILSLTRPPDEWACGVQYSAAASHCAPRAVQTLASVLCVVPSRAIDVTRCFRAHRSQQSPSHLHPCGARTVAQHRRRPDDSSERDAATLRQPCLSEPVCDDRRHRMPRERDNESKTGAEEWRKAAMEHTFRS